MVDLTPRDGLDVGWSAALAPVVPRIAELERFLDAEVAAGHGFLPEADRVLRAFSAPLADARVLIVGQDPYPTPGHSVGLPFSTDPWVRPIPRSLANIYRELESDLGIRPPAGGDLTPWTRQGVLLLNRVLTVRPSVSGSHRRRGWEAVTARAIEAFAERDTPVVAILWGKDAAGVKPLLGSAPIIESAHPSPLSASRGFFGSRPFSRANEHLLALGADPVDWSLG